MRADAHDVESRVFEELSNRRAREVVEVHVEQKHPRSSHHARNPAADVGIVDDEQPFVLQQPMGFANFGLRIRRVLEHVPQRDDVVGLRRGSSARTPCPVESAGRSSPAPNRTASDSARSLRLSTRDSTRRGGRSRRRFRCRADVRACRFQMRSIASRHLRERDLASAGLRDELFVGSAGVALEHRIGPQARAHVLQPAARAGDELMIQALVARAAERSREVCRFESIDVVR